MIEIGGLELEYFSLLTLIDLIDCPFSISQIFK